MSEDLEDLGLFREYAATRSRSTRNELVQRHMGLATHVAARYARTARHDEDLRQVAMVGLIKAVDRFDPEYGAAFSLYAGRTIEGELKRHFRDKTWTVKVPRSAKELHLLVRNATTELEQRDGRSPSVGRLAEYLEIDRDDVVRGLEATAAARVDTIDVVGTGGDDAPATDRQMALATDDRSFADRENDMVVAELLERLPEREQEIVRLRFYENMSQTEIADRVGVSQMQVSRLLRQSFERMRSWMTERSA
ncbi:SigB/SigF/SigG family RNA polymerase sigma factor [Ilumatobacter coccineus]|uniref:RNA polymerase sigma factor SigF n=1 Tax=Ilumatobacter coccineus (strain NBRC 103263 / KCTC 29153 / YM16-304) TaxID=1313172 RepID=A0A6C7E8T9_ILUCY|nr:SigB/SigF/SigG family RNA polymerase sigma factor [Ilumatobacter coccineus]BAN04074.1 RNA polymerase sigma factor SigF [Ilumatobacter coccineus YM16-304]